MGRVIFQKFSCYAFVSESYIDANTEVIQVLIKKASFKTLKRYGESQYNPSMHHFFMDTTLDRLYFREVFLKIRLATTYKYSGAETASNTVTWDSVFNHSDFTMIGRELFNQENKRPQKEIDLYNDILFLSAVQFLFSYCHHHYNFPYALFVDEDYLVLVSIATYPFNCYPPYITVGAVLLSSQTIRKMYYAIQHTKLYSYDDIYAGILAKSLKLTIKHNKNMYWKAEVGVEEAKTLICA
uniref:Hexosyltransferase n=1 Tax=Wuchereria bancrofti TaxID=6293 RepID=A0A1I8EUI0_WUCBA